MLDSSHAGDEESVSAIQSFINETSSPIKTPSPSVRITSTATGVVNIKAVPQDQVVMSTPTSQVIRQIPTSTPRGRGRPPKTITADTVVGSVRNMKGVSMVTLTAGGIIKKVTPAPSSNKRKRAQLDSDDEGDSDDLYDDDDDDDDDDELGLPMKKVAGASPGTAAAENVTNNGQKKSGDRDYKPPKKLDDSANLSEADVSADLDSSRSKRQRKEKKIFDL